MPRLSSEEFPLGDAASAIIAELGKMTPETINNSQSEKHKAIELSKKLTATLEGPLNRATELVLKPFISIAARIAVGLNLFSPIVERKDSFITTEELAKITGAEELLVSRIIRALASVDFVTEAEPDQWTANATTKAMALAPVAAGHRFMYDSLVCAAITAPKFLAETGYKSPTEPRDGLIQYANQTKLDIFEFLQTTPSLFQDFNLYMGNTMGSREYWCDWYDVKGRLLDGFDAGSSDVLFVDVAGGNGHDLQTFHERFKDHGYQGELVLQEIPAVLNDIQEGELDKVVKRMVHDFFTEQPIKGARVYNMTHILHDWSDKYSHIILKHLRDAMKPGYSKLIIRDLVLPDTGVTEHQASFDMALMAFNSGIERSSSQWRKLLEEAGFKVTGIWGWLDKEGIVEAEVP